MGNMDCTFCLDCVHACPHDNIGLIARVPTQELWSDPFRSGIGRFSRRPDLAALVVVLVFASFINAFNMIRPVYGLPRTTGGPSGPLVTRAAPGTDLHPRPDRAAGLTGVAGRLARAATERPERAAGPGYPALCLRPRTAGLRCVAGPLQLSLPDRRPDHRPRGAIISGRCRALRRHSAMGSRAGGPRRVAVRHSRPSSSIWALPAR